MKDTDTAITQENNIMESPEVLEIQAKLKKIEEDLAFVNKISDNDSKRAFFTKNNLLIWYGEVIEIAKRDSNGTWGEREKLFYDGEYDFEDPNAPISMRVDRGAPIMIGPRLYAFDYLNEARVDYSEESDLQRLGAYEMITCSLLNLVKDPERYYKDIKWKRTKLGNLATDLLYTIEEQGYDMDRKYEVMKELIESDYLDEISNIDYESDKSVWSLYHEKERLNDEKQMLEKRLKKIINPSPSISSLLKKKTVVVIIAVIAVLALAFMMAPAIILSIDSSSSSESYVSAAENPDAESTGSEEVKSELEKKYDYVSDFEHGLYQVCKNNLYGFCDIDGKEVCRPKYDMIGAFDNGVYEVSINDRYGLVNALGQEILSPAYEMIGSLEHGLIEVMKNDKYGYVNLEGQVIAPCKYDMVMYNDGLFELSRDDKTIYMDQKGNIVSKE